MDSKHRRLTISFGSEGYLLIEYGTYIDGIGILDYNGAVSGDVVCSSSNGDNTFDADVDDPELGVACVEEFGWIINESLYG